MAQYIDKSAVVAEIKKRAIEAGLHDSIIAETREDECYSILSFLDTLEVKEVDLDTLGVLAEHLIACDAHLVTPKYTDKELDLLEELVKNNKTQKGG